MASRPILSALQVAQEANATAYRRAVQGSGPGECWDYLVLTATNEKQAEGYRQELALRQRAVGPAGAFFPAFQKSVVVADPPGPRIGSGGATLNVLRALVRDHGVDPRRLDDLRILLIHSGGLSQRLPAYSPLGKIFAPLPLLRPDAQVATLFDHLYVTLSGLAERLGPGMLVLAGDVFLLFDHRHVSQPGEGVTALTFRVDPEVALAHGVFVTDASGGIRKTLQKVSVQQMQVEGATDAQGRVLIDTGLLFFDPKRTRALAGLAGVATKAAGKAAKTVGKAGASRKPAAAIHERYGEALDLYVDVVTAITTTARPADFETPMRKELYRTLRGTRFAAMVLDGEFLHLGTTRQFRDAMTGRSTSPVAALLQQNVLVHSAAELPEDCRVYHTAILEGENGQTGGRAAIGTGSLIESSILGPGSRIGPQCVVSQVYTGSRSLELPEGVLFFQVPVRPLRAERAARAGSSKHGEAPLLFAQVLCGVEDDFKGRHADGQCRFLNAPIGRWLELHGVTAEDLWGVVPAKERTLWNARLFPATADRADFAPATWFARLEAAPRRAVEQWRRSPRYSMAMILEQADPAAMIEHRETVTALAQAGFLLDSIRRGEDRSVDELMLHYATGGAYRLGTERLVSFARLAGKTPAETLWQARAYWCVSQLSRRPTHAEAEAQRGRGEAFATQAFAKIAEASESAHIQLAAEAESPAAAARLRPGQTITATSPVRLDLSGGWSDTPPYCYERGGHVVNVAIDLDGRSPIRAVVRTTFERRLIVDSQDLGQRVDLAGQPVGAEIDVRDPFALHKVALQMTGLLPSRTGGATDRSGAARGIADHLRRLGAGLEITTECRLPKGSGLGTSSILAATLLAALNRLTGRRVSTTGLVEQTLLLEQRLSTGGGWQDQVGGIVGGIKSTVTAPGLPQRPIIEELDLNDRLYDAFQERLVVYYSGQQRLARDILRRVMGRWLAREPAMTVLMERLKQSAADLRTALLKGRWPRVAEEIARYWQIKRELYPGSTTPAVDVMMLELRDLYAAAGLAGAGGGGFAYFFCRDGRQARRLADALAERSARPGSLGAVYPATVNRRGLVVKAT